MGWWSNLRPLSALVSSITVDSDQHITQSVLSVHEKAVEIHREGHDCCVDVLFCHAAHFTCVDVIKETGRDSRDATHEVK